MDRRHVEGVVAHLGDFGEQVDEPEEVTFGYFGETVRVNPALSDLDLVDFVDLVGDGTGLGLEQVGLIKDFARQCIHGDDFDRFWATARNNRQGITEVYELLAKIVAAVTERPTGRSSGSAGGPSSTSTNSADDDLSTALQRYEGRPDFQLALVRAHEEQAAV